MLLPHPDPGDPDTIWAGVIKRFASRPPVANSARMRRLEKFVRKWLRENLKPLDRMVDLSVPSWLATANYPLWRKAQLQQIHESMEGNVWSNPKIREVKSFMKDEHYPSFKHARAINARSDEFKCIVGPLFHAIEQQVFQHPAFIKKVPVDQRPEYIINRIHRHGATYIATDYTSFESLFTEQLMQSVEFQLYKYMTSNLPENQEFTSICDEILGGRNVCRFRDFTVEIDATRMSGEMCTSLGNGFANLMFMEFLCEERGATHRVGVVEGDDGLYRVEGNSPTVEDFESLGLKIKLEKHKRLETASFCGLVFDLDDRINVTDPRPALVKFGWTSGSFATAGEKKLSVLLRAKAMSMKHQYSGCPILDALANYGLRITSRVSNDALRRYVERDGSLGWWERREMLRLLSRRSLPCKPVGDKTRLLVEELYGVTVEMQLHIEAYLDGLTEKQPLDMSVLRGLIPEDWVTYWNEYVLRPIDNIQRHPLQIAAYIGFTKEFTSWEDNP